MDFKQIQELIKMINKSNIGELTIEQKDFRVTIKQKEEHGAGFTGGTMAVQMPTQTMAPVHSSSTQAPEKPSEDSPASKLITIKSPMIGTFYRKSAPDK